MTSIPEPAGSRPELPLLINPAAGRGAGRRRAEAMRRILERTGREVVVRYSDGPGGVAALIRDAVGRGSREVVLAGGDGTVSEAVNAILGDELGTAIGIVPAGTGNDFVKSLGTPRHWRNACEQLAIGIVERRRRRVDAGRCNEFWFANSVGIGLDAVVTNAAGKLRWLPGMLAYPAALARVLADGVGSAMLEVEVDGQSLRCEASMLIACNGAWFGGLFHIAPPARIDDGLLSVVIAAPLSRARLLRLVPRAVRGSHMSAAEATLLTGRELSVEVSRPMPMEADGETGREAPTRLEMRCLPGALSVIA